MTAKKTTIFAMVAVLILVISAAVCIQQDDAKTIYTDVVEKSLYLSSDKVMFDNDEKNSTKGTIYAGAYLIKSGAKVTFVLDNHHYDEDGNDTLGNVFGGVTNLKKLKEATKEKETFEDLLSYDTKDIYRIKLKIFTDLMQSFQNNAKFVFENGATLEIVLESENADGTYSKQVFKEIKLQQNTIIELEGGDVSTEGTKDTHDEPYTPGNSEKHANDKIVLTEKNSFFLAIQKGVGSNFDTYGIAMPKNNGITIGLEDAKRPGYLAENIHFDGTASQSYIGYEDDNGKFIKEVEYFCGGIICLKNAYDETKYNYFHMMQTTSLKDVNYASLSNMSVRLGKNVTDTREVLFTPLSDNDLLTVIFGLNGVFKDETSLYKYVFKDGNFDEIAFNSQTFHDSTITTITFNDKGTIDVVNLVTVTATGSYTESIHVTYKATIDLSKASDLKKLISSEYWSIAALDYMTEGSEVLMKNNLHYLTVGPFAFDTIREVFDENLGLTLDYPNIFNISHKNGMTVLTPSAPKSIKDEDVSTSPDMIKRYPNLMIGEYSHLYMRLSKLDISGTIVTANKDNFNIQFKGSFCDLFSDGGLKLLEEGGFSITDAKLIGISFDGNNSSSMYYDGKDVDIEITLTGSSSGIKAKLVDKNGTEYKKKTTTGGTEVVDAIFIQTGDYWEGDYGLGELYIRSQIYIEAENHTLEFEIKNTETKIITASKPLEYHATVNYAPCEDTEYKVEPKYTLDAKISDVSFKLNPGDNYNIAFKIGQIDLDYVLYSYSPKFPLEDNFIEIPRITFVGIEADLNVTSLSKLKECSANIALEFRECFKEGTNVLDYDVILDNISEAVKCFKYGNSSNYLKVHTISMDIREDLNLNIGNAYLKGYICLNDIYVSHSSSGEFTAGMSKIDFWSKLYMDCTEKEWTEELEPSASFELYTGGEIFCKASIDDDKNINLHLECAYLFGKGTLLFGSDEEALTINIAFSTAAIDGKNGYIFDLASQKNADGTVTFERYSYLKQFTLDIDGTYIVIEDVESNKDKTKYLSALPYLQQISLVLPAKILVKDCGGDFDFLTIFTTIFNPIYRTDAPSEKTPTSYDSKTIMNSILTNVAKILYNNGDGMKGHIGQISIEFSGLPLVEKEKEKEETGGETENALPTSWISMMPAFLCKVKTSLTINDLAYESFDEDGNVYFGFTFDGIVVEMTEDIVGQDFYLKLSILDGVSGGVGFSKNDDGAYEIYGATIKAGLFNIKAYLDLETTIYGWSPSFFAEETANDEKEPVNKETLIRINDTTVNASIEGLEATLKYIGDYDLFETILDNLMNKFEARGESTFGGSDIGEILYNVSALFADGSHVYSPSINVYCDAEVIINTTTTYDDLTSEAKNYVIPFELNISNVYFGIEKIGTIDIETGEAGYLNLLFSSGTSVSKLATYATRAESEITEGEYVYDFYMQAFGDISIGIDEKISLKSSGKTLFYLDLSKYGIKMTDGTVLDFVFSTDETGHGYGSFGYLSIANGTLDIMSDLDMSYETLNKLRNIPVPMIGMIASSAIYSLFNMPMVLEDEQKISEDVTWGKGMLAFNGVPLVQSFKYTKDDGTVTEGVIFNVQMFSDLYIQIAQGQGVYCEYGFDIAYGDGKTFNTGKIHFNPQSVGIATEYGEYEVKMVEVNIGEEEIPAGVTTVNFAKDQSPHSAVVFHNGADDLAFISVIKQRVNTKGVEDPTTLFAEKQSVFIAKKTGTIADLPLEKKNGYEPFWGYFNAEGKITPYDPETPLSGIKYVLLVDKPVVFEVNVYDEDGETVIGTYYVKYDDSVYSDDKCTQPAYLTAPYKEGYISYKWLDMETGKEYTINDLYKLDGVTSETKLKLKPIYEGEKVSFLLYYEVAEGDLVDTKYTISKRVGEAFGEIELPVFDSYYPGAIKTIGGVPYDPTWIVTAPEDGGVIIIVADAEYNPYFRSFEVDINGETHTISGSFNDRYYNDVLNEELGDEIPEDLKDCFAGWFYEENGEDKPLDGLKVDVDDLKSGIKAKFIAKVVVEDETYETYIGDSFLLPDHEDTEAGKFIGWKVNGETYEAGHRIVIEDKVVNLEPLFSKAEDITITTNVPGAKVIIDGYQGEYCDENGEALFEEVPYGFYNVKVQVGNVEYQGFIIVDENPIEYPVIIPETGDDVFKISIKKNGNHVSANGLESAVDIESGVDTTVEIEFKDVTDGVIFEESKRLLASYDISIKKYVNNVFVEDVTSTNSPVDLYIELNTILAGYDISEIQVYYHHDGEIIKLEKNELESRYYKVGSVAGLDYLIIHTDQFCEFDIVAHTHNYDEHPEYGYDETYHWHYCSECGLVKEKHVLVDGKCACGYETHVPVKYIVIDGDTSRIAKKGDGFYIDVIINESASDKRLVWTSSDEDIATVDDTGFVHIVGKKSGEAVITVTSVDSGVSAQCYVKVTGGDDESGSGSTTADVLVVIAAACAAAAAIFVTALFVMKKR